MKLFSLIILLLSLFSAVFAKNKCCEKCPAGEEKFYSIDLLFNKCGECCMNPKKYWIYHIFELGLTKAESDHPCYDHGYPNYQKTETHGSLLVKMTLDKYSQ
ncbi:hypothetical protein H8356DRAFT_1423028 [Neocallimastix lanati (nom. inval.)]|uniref:Uncharacterized protein n=1 Tax=Neocallimastix californiae TaxID=1754190 RepID=A0A1Y2EX42_9FUNG|nr:hypothetical protein H8356DRAFT_1423028 [Neocallimastix sp. JGI-2020a]ORY76130.1 hypothetical protein LY90DRAFT_665640 [Neocallimastix californiae]|eukprot:ORY76130.1 hypothetical protein LY90DRAFT_665640 [Neocallimastix californiae]